MKGEDGFCLHVCERVWSVLPRSQLQTLIYGQLVEFSLNLEAGSVIQSAILNQQMLLI